MESDNLVSEIRTDRVSHIVSQRIADHHDGLASLFNPSAVQSGEESYYKVLLGVVVQSAHREAYSNVLPVSGKS